MKRNKIIYWVATGLLSALMLMSIGMYFFNYAEVAATFEKLGYPSYIVYPLAVVKLLGIVAILTKKSDILKEWAYAGFFFDFVLAFFAHVNIGDGEQFGAVVALVLWTVSYTFDKIVFKKNHELTHA